MSADLSTPVVVTPAPAPPAPRAPVLADPSLAHQINLTWATGSKQETVVLCNCGWTGMRRRPEVMGTIVAAIAEWEGHVTEVGYLQIELT